MPDLPPSISSLPGTLGTCTQQHPVFALISVRDRSDMSNQYLSFSIRVCAFSSRFFVGCTRPRVRSPQLPSPPVRFWRPPAGGHNNCRSTPFPLPTPRRRDLHPHEHSQQRVSSSHSGLVSYMYSYREVGASRRSKPQATHGHTARLPQGTTVLVHAYGQSLCWPRPSYMQSASADGAHSPIVRLFHRRDAIVHPLLAGVHPQLPSSMRTSTARNVH